MENNFEKKSLRKVLLEKRDNTSEDLIKIASKQIHKNLKKMGVFSNAKNIACYYPIGSEVLTHDIMQEAISEGKEILLPKVANGELVFKKIKDVSQLEKGNFGIMEPKEVCEIADKIDLVIVPTIGISRKGSRLGYGFGYYDRFLAKIKAPSISLVYAKQIVKSIPTTEHDVRIDWIVSEDEYCKSL